jgi:hypothetical protein
MRMLLYKDATAALETTSIQPISLIEQPAVPSVKKD